MLAYVEWPWGQLTDPTTRAAYQMIANYVGLDELADKDALLTCRSLVVESVTKLRYPRDVRPIVNEIDSKLMAAHGMAVCGPCGTVVAKKGETCGKCEPSGLSSFLDVPAIVALEVARATGLLAPVARLISGYVVARGYYGLDLARG